MGAEGKPQPYVARLIRIGVHHARLRDLYHFLLTTSWPKLFALIVVTYVAANAAFAAVYWIDGGVENARPGSYFDAFFFSAQTMATVGYGKMTPRSLVANVCAAGEALAGLIGLAMATGLMFAKFARPTARVIWTKQLVVTVRDGKPSLLVRLGNERMTGLVEATLSLVLILEDRTSEGEAVRRIIDLPLVRSHHAMFALTWTAVHVIDEKSPLFGATRDSLHERQAEIVASLVGIEEATAQTVHARNAWGPDELLFNKRFADVLGTHPSGRPVLDYSRFHDVEDEDRA